MSTTTYAAVRACALAMIAGTILHAASVTAGNGIIVDWRTVKSGEEIQKDGDAFDTAQLFVALVGADAALAALAGESVSAAEAVPPASVVVAFMVDPGCGGRRRCFDAGPFRVYVEPDADDEKQAAFTERLAAFCASEGVAS